MENVPDEIFSGLNKCEHFADKPPAKLGVICAVQMSSKLILIDKF